ncbi:FHA domain-containing protein [Actinoplanes italicus]|uniref:FHA domain-containing protein n=1 Tax=Actinoplanes italicus TaxID=113567 RepID=A0A2T0K304_9ACTN|nr:FHA domain-containing protein [Actinoplanes italicus]PRX17243.1 FHA domain-containing protein [Actinoplanes italicus]
MSQVCPRCGLEPLYDDTEAVCPIHILALEPYVAARADAGRPPEPDLAEPEPEPEDTALSCWNCGTEVPHPSNVECLEPACRRPLTPPALVIRFADGQVEVARGTRAELGRSGRYVGLFRAYPNVSRRHAVVGADPDGRAWIEPVPTPNGTFLDGSELPASERTPLRSNTRVRFALHAEGTVTVHSRRGD